MNFLACLSSPCKNEGSCQSVNNRFTCNCTNDFTGFNCLYKILNSSIFKNSTILTNKQSLELCNLTNIPTKKSLPLLYQASRDGFKASDFHAKVDGIQGTLTIIRTVDDFIFGGYTEINWEGTSAVLYDPNSFIFSFINNFNNSVKMNIKNALNSIVTRSSNGPIFGTGYDIYISDKSNINSDSYSYISGYEMPSFGYSTTLLAGSYNFKTFEIEVYSVIIDRMYYLYF